MDDFNWMIFGILWIGSVSGTIAVLPYALELNKDKLADAPMSLPKMVLLGALQASILFGVMTFLGLNAADAIGLSIGVSSEVLLLAMMMGIVSTLLLVTIEYAVFQPHMPSALRNKTHQLPVWKRFLASFYGGITEEVMTRLFLVSGIAWLLLQVTVLPVDSAIGIAIILSALLFGIGHLPATASLTPLTPLIIVRGLVLNGIIGLLAGWLFWQYGFVAAIVAHFCADIVLHVIVPILMKPQDNMPAMQIS